MNARPKCKKCNGRGWRHTSGDQWPYKCASCNGKGRHTQKTFAALIGVCPATLRRYNDPETRKFLLPKTIERLERRIAEMAS